MGERCAYVLKRADARGVPADDSAPPRDGATPLPRAAAVLEKLSASAVLRTWQRRAFWLSGYFLAYGVGGRAALGAVDLRGVEAVEASGRFVTLVFVSGCGTYALRAPTAAAAEAWAAALQARVDWATAQTLPPDAPRRARLRRRASSGSSSSSGAGARALDDAVTAAHAVAPASQASPAAVAEREPAPHSSATWPRHARPPAARAAAAPPPTDEWLRAYSQTNVGAWQAPTAAWLTLECRLAPPAAASGGGGDDARKLVQRALPAAGDALAARCAAAAAARRDDVAAHLCEAWAARVALCVAPLVRAAAGSGAPAQHLRLASLLWDAAAVDVACATESAWRRALEAAAEDAERAFLASVERTLRACAGRVVAALSAAPVAATTPRAASALFAPRRAPAVEDAAALASGATLARDFFAIGTQVAEVAPKLRGRVVVVLCCEAARLAGDAYADAATAAAATDAGQQLSVGRLVRTLDALRDLGAIAARAAATQQRDASAAAADDDVRRALDEMRRAHALALDLAARLVADDALAEWREAAAAAARATPAARAAAAAAAAVSHADALLLDIFPVGQALRRQPRAAAADDATVRVCGRVTQRLVLHVLLDVLAPRGAPMPVTAVAACAARLRAFADAWLGGRGAAEDATAAVGVVLELLLAPTAAEMEERAVAAAHRRAHLGVGLRALAVRHVSAAAGLLARRRWGRAAGRDVESRVARRAADAPRSSTPPPRRDSDGPAASAEDGGADADVDADACLDLGDARDDYDCGVSGVLRGWSAAHASAIVMHKALVRARAIAT
jgi:hypothetical protein